MSYNENHGIISNDEHIETKPIKTQHKPIDPHQHKTYYHTKVAPVQCDICGCGVVNRALHNHKRTSNCKLVKHFKNIAQLEYDELNVTHNITT